MRWLVLVSMVSGGCIYVDGEAIQKPPAPLPAGYEPSAQNWGRATLLDDLDPFTDTRRVTLLISESPERASNSVSLRCEARREVVALSGHGVHLEVFHADYRFDGREPGRAMLEPTSNYDAGVTENPRLVATFRAGIASSDQLVFRLPGEVPVTIELGNVTPAIEAYTTACDEVRGGG